MGKMNCVVPSRRKSIKKGQVFGRLKVLKEEEGVRIKSGNKTIPRRVFSCVCNCGKVVKVQLQSLTSGKKSSCGCLKQETSVKNGYKTFLHKKTNTGVYRSWLAMKSRCLRPTHPAYKLYKDVKICPAWINDFCAFYTDMGERPDGMSLDRKDNKKGYYKENCRWADSYTQNNNMSSNRRVTYHGKIYTVAEMSRLTGISHATLTSRLNKNWHIDEVVETPVKCSFKKEVRNERDLSQ